MYYSMNIQTTHGITTTTITTNYIWGHSLQQPGAPFLSKAVSMIFIELPPFQLDKEGMYYLPWKALCSTLLRKWSPDQSRKIHITH